MEETILEKAPIGLLTLDEEGTITWTNEVYADLLEIPYDELIGMPFYDLVLAGYFDESVVGRYLDAVRRILSSSADADESSYLVRTHLPDGGTRIHDVSTALLPLKDGEFRGTVNAFRDITKQKEYEWELRRQNERLEEFTSVVSHDLRNPLNVAQGNLQFAFEADDRDELEAALEKVSRAHARMATLIDDLLSLSREGRTVENPEPVDVEGVARRAWESVRTDDAVLKVVDDPGRVVADASRLQQVFENLFRNSVDHGDDGGCTVAIGPLDDGTGFFVADDGPGIPPDVRDSVFDRGFTTAPAGTGFGLAIVRTIVEAHGWTIEAVDGDGARFEITTATELLA